MSHSVYIANLPASITEPDLELFFSLCGPIESSKVERYVDDKDGQRAYGFITFRDQESMQKALVFDQSNYQRHIIRVLPIKTTHFGTFLGGIPNSVPVADITEWLKARYPRKFDEDIVQKQTPRGSYIFVNFLDEESRQKFIRESFLFTKQRATIKEPPKRTADPTPAEGRFEIRVSNIPSEVSDEEVRKLFVLFDGDVTSNIDYSEGMLLSASVVFHKNKAVDYAMRFDGHPVNGWSHPIRLQRKGRNYGTADVGSSSDSPQSKAQTDEYPYKVTISNVDSDLELWDIEQRLAELGQAHAVRSASCRNEVIVSFRTEQSRDTAVRNIGNANIGANGPAVIRTSTQLNPVQQRMVSDAPVPYWADDDAVEYAESPSNSIESLTSIPYQQSRQSLTYSTEDLENDFGRRNVRTNGFGSLGFGRRGLGRYQTPSPGAERENAFGGPQGTAGGLVWNITVECGSSLGQVTQVFERLGSVRSCSASAPNTFKITIAPNL